ncbi:hypothetical protein [Mangrovibacterium sp.]|uniref:HNH endonuclease n=1 Tax=Mangrovibacterium sp. TaxID=1961364 RepID=UPI003568B20C
MEFNINQFLKFGTKDGSYSIVTEREYYDSQITATDAEAELLINHFGLSNITVGKVASNPRLSKKEFLLYPSGQKIYLNLVFPKNNKPELRLYISQTAGFKPESGTVWFLFKLQNKLWIGSMPENQWRAENIGALEDDSDSIYQSLIQEKDEIKIAKLASKEAFTRDRKLAQHRMTVEDYRCECNPSHELFISKYTNLPYLEAHHLIPISLQKQYNKNFDLLDNIFCLCPFCHRAIHFSEQSTSRPIIDTLLDKRPEVLNIIRGTEQDIYKFYSLETII